MTVRFNCGFDLMSNYQKLSSSISLCTKKEKKALRLMRLISEAVMYGMHCWGTAWDKGGKVRELQGTEKPFDNLAALFP